MPRFLGMLAAFAVPIVVVLVLKSQNGNLSFDELPTLSSFSDSAVQNRPDGTLYYFYAPS